MTVHDEPPHGSVCEHCRHEYWQHGSYDGITHRCPDADSTFQRRALKAPNPAQSFTPEQVDWLAEVVEALQRGEDIAQQLVAVRKLARDPHLGPVARKVAVMKASSAMRKKGAAE